MLAEPNINILLTRNLPFDPDVRHGGHLLMIPLHFCGTKRATERVVNLNVIWLGFVFVLISFIQLHGVVVVPVFPRFQFVQIKQVDCKINIENVNDYK